MLTIYFFYVAHLFMYAHVQSVPTVDLLVKAMEESDDSLLVGSARVRMGAVGIWLREGFDIEHQQYIVRHKPFLTALLTFSPENVSL
jgi:hypothetical protein